MSAEFIGHAGYFLEEEPVSNLGDKRDDFITWNQVVTQECHVIRDTFCGARAVGAAAAGSEGQGRMARAVGGVVDGLVVGGLVGGVGGRRVKLSRIA